MGVLLSRFSGSIDGIFTISMAQPCRPILENSSYPHGREKRKKAAGQLACRGKTLKLQLIKLILRNTV